MDSKVQDELTAIVAKDTWTADDCQALWKLLFATKDASGKFRSMVADIRAADPEPRGLAALKLGIGYFMLCQFRQALGVLTDATDNKDRRWFQAQCYKCLRQYDRAAEDLERARDRGWDELGIALELIEVRALAGDVEAAAKDLAKLQRKAEQTAQFWYLKGLLAELGDRDQVAEAYQRAREIDPNHPGATFRLAYYSDLHGDEETAVELYKRCCAQPPVHANALLNLAVLCEDAGDYVRAASYLKKVLACNPTHERARLFLKDVEAAQTMYYDEDQARRIARRNAVLDIPVTDFELSVRARNCLKKMNIRTLGDLVRTTESELLGYKNFGETSLKEIKDMLSAKGLHLGQALEEEAELEALPGAGGPHVANEGVLGTPVAQIDFSIRARKALETLRIETLGDLTAKTEAELLACKNFGQTSLNEVCQRLAEYGLRLREPN
jgi:DNA-directed RNA polymerase subunit alpha